MRKEHLLPVDAIAQGERGLVLGIEGAKPGFLQTTPWYSSSPWREAVTNGRVRAHLRLEGELSVGAARRSIEDRGRSIGLR
jgi:hypothetical protein